MNWDYIAGFFDGEGNLHTNIVRSKKENNKLRSVQLVCRLYSSNKEVLLKLKEFMGFGNIYSKREDMYELVISKKKEVFFFLNNIKELVILKKDQINYVLNNFNFKESNNFTFDIDKFRSFITRKNVEKHRTNTNKKIGEEILLLNKPYTE